jgi:hypothetical protein
MIEISISRELADAHPGFIAGCAKRGHRVQVIANPVAGGDATAPAGELGGPDGRRHIDGGFGGGSSAGGGEGPARHAAGGRPCRR